MRGEHCARLDRFEGRGKVEALFLDQDPRPLQSGKRGMPFIHMADGRLLAQRPKRAQAADAQNDFLLNPRVRVAAIELSGDLAILRTIDSECCSRADTEEPGRR